MVGTPMNGRRLSFGFGNGGHELGPSSTPPSNAGSDYGSFVDFTRDDVEALLNEKSKRKDRFNYKVCESLIL